MTNEYTKYLKSEKWAEIKKRLFKKRGKKCEKCGKINILHIHHLTYRNIFNEKDEDLIILCNLCHEKAHGIKKPVVKRRCFNHRRDNIRFERSDTDY